MAAATVPRTDSLEATSQCTKRAFAPASSTVSMPATRSTSATITDAPDRANANAHARPRPPPGPGASAPLPLKSYVTWLRGASRVGPVVEPVDEHAQPRPAVA